MPNFLTGLGQGLAGSNFGDLLAKVALAQIQKRERENALAEFEKRATQTISRPQGQTVYGQPERVTSGPLPSMKVQYPTQLPTMAPVQVPTPVSSPEYMKSFLGLANVDPDLAKAADALQKSRFPQTSLQEFSA